MASLAPEPFAGANGSDRFFVRGAMLMAALIVTGFSFQYLMGRSTFAAPLRVHLHAFFFMGWVAIYLAQNLFIAQDRMALHRRLGWIGAAWIVPMVVMGTVVTVAMVRQGAAPFFFTPLQFLVFDPVTVLTFAGLTTAAVVLRRQTQWHRRLHFCGMSLLLGPAFGRLLPLPFMTPWAWEATFAVCMLFPLAGMVADARREGRVHPAWHWGLGVMLASFVLTEAITFSPVGTALYRTVTAGSTGARVPPLAFPPPPAGMLPGH